jgi:hypothetical protein
MQSQQLRCTDKLAEFQECRSASIPPPDAMYQTTCPSHFNSVSADIATRPRSQIKQCQLQRTDRRSSIFHIEQILYGDPDGDMKVSMTWRVAKRMGEDATKDDKRLLLVVFLIDLRRSKLGAIHDLNGRTGPL